MKSIYKFLYFNKNERIALFVFLVVLIFTSVFYQFLKPQVFKSNYEFSDLSTNWIDTSSSSQIAYSINKLYPNPQQPAQPPKQYIPLNINVNLADSIELMQLKGIGKVFSSRIVRYRNWLGGFYCEEQLVEVYGIDSVLFKSISPYISVLPNTIRKININSCELNDLSSHPYISFKVAKSIVKYRDHHGAYISISDLKRIPLIDEKLFRKIANYLDVE